MSRRLALLLCDKPIEPIRVVHGDYLEIFTRLLSRSLARINSQITFTLDGYDVVKERAYPLDDVPYDGLLISGSRASAYEDVPWINTLITYVRRIITEKPSLKVFGICFGHQIVARALGGTCVQNNGLWEVAVTTVQLTPLGKTIFGSDELDVQQMHRDHVPGLPPSAHLLGSTDITPVHGMAVFDPGSEPTSGDAHVSLTSIHVLTVQGHPEFTAPFMTMLLDARVSLLGDELVKDGRLRANGIPGRQYPDGLTCDGVSGVGKAIWGVLGIK